MTFPNFGASLRMSYIKLA